ncbi:hypothetical protein CDL12_11861 [Handroanthus impetiginosus]|uniref:PGG domain-containing protein n=1 Tax=Handroanthus impetiginosus TaxID=429701 RepID=A0A2G9HDB0_9LAMI|nr:hypothetical protein CDL12_11861 [Handroanthus impetiginosus]
MASGRGILPALTHLVLDFFSHYVVLLVVLVLNVILYFIVTAIAAWAANHAIERSHESASVSSLSAQVFPIDDPFGNMATGFVVIFSLIAGVVGFTTSTTTIYNVMRWNASNLDAAATSSVITWLLTLLAMGLACKEIDTGWTGSNLRTLETILIVLIGTQLYCTIAIYVRLSVVLIIGRDFI